MSLVVAVQIAIVQYGGAVFATVPLTTMQWMTIILASASILVVGVVLRIVYGLFRNRHNRQE